MWSEDCWRVPPALVPAPAPVWMLPDVAPAFSETSTCFKRPFTCKNDCKRWHAGIDIKAKGAGVSVVAAEDCTVLPGAGGKIERGWTSGTRQLFCRNAGSWAVYGGIKPGSALALGHEPGSVVAAGTPLGVIAQGYDMLHFELYDGGTKLKGNQRWWVGETPPPALRNPLGYVQTAAGMTRTLGTVIERHEALQRLGFYAGPTFAPWGASSKEALIAAQTALGLDADGAWGPQTDGGIRRALGGRAPAVQRTDSWLRHLPAMIAGGFALGLYVGLRRLGDRQ